MFIWLGPALALIGVLIGGIITYIVTRTKLRHDKSLEKDKLYLEKLEQLYRTITNLIYIYRSNMSSALYGKGDNKLPTIPIDQIDMLIGFYAPELNDDFQQLERARSDYGKVKAEFDVYRIMRRKEKKDFEPNIIKEIKSRIGQAYDQLEDRCKLLQNKVKAISNESVDLLRRS